jgi:hypothetical protein
MKRTLPWEEAKSTEGGEGRRRRYKPAIAILSSIQLIVDSLDPLELELKLKQ